jgi:YbbR domain-containing protein
MALLRIRHIGLKVVSVVLAALLWLLVSGEQTVERALRIPLEFTNLPPQLELVGAPPAVVDVRVRGSSGTLSRVAAGELSAVLDVRAARAGDRLFHLTPEDVRAPFGVEVVQVTPASVPLTFEESLSKTVGVTVRIEGDPAPGYAVGGVTVDPATVAIVGPASALGGLTEAVTEPISVSGASRPVKDTVTIGVADPVVRLKQAQTASVTISIAAAPDEWVVRGIAVQVRNSGSKTMVLPGDVTVWARGPRDSKDTDPAHYTAAVDVTGLAAGRHMLPVRVEAPTGIGLLRVDPPDVAVTIQPRGSR